MINTSITTRFKSSHNAEVAKQIKEQLVRDREANMEANNDGSLPKHVNEEMGHMYLCNVSLKQNFVQDIIMLLIEHGLYLSSSTSAQCLENQHVVVYL